MAAFFWSIGNLCNLFYGAHNLKRILKESGYIEALIKKDPKKLDDFKSQLENLKRQKGVMMRLILKALGDLVTSLAVAGISEKLGFMPSDGTMGVGGFVSATIATYEAYKLVAK